jgi:hypothetical protein
MDAGFWSLDLRCLNSAVRSLHSLILLVPLLLVAEKTLRALMHPHAQMDFMLLTPRQPYLSTTPVSLPASRMLRRLQRCDPPGVSFSSRHQSSCCSAALTITLLKFYIAPATRLTSRRGKRKRNLYLHPRTAR